MKCIKIGNKYVKTWDNIAKICDDIDNVCNNSEKRCDDIANICDKCAKSCNDIRNVHSDIGNVHYGIGDVHDKGRIIHFKNGRYLDFLKVAFGKIPKSVACVERSIGLKKHHRNFLSGHRTMLYSFGYNQEFIFF
jgi:hypothetical protein